MIFIERMTDSDGARLKTGRAKEVKRRDEAVRGGPGYAVDLDDPLERELLYGQEGRLAPVEEIKDGRSRPKRPTELSSADQKVFDQMVKELRESPDKRWGQLFERRDAYLASLAEKPKSEKAPQGASGGSGAAGGSDAASGSGGQETASQAASEGDKPEPKA